MDERSHVPEETSTRLEMSTMWTMPRTELQIPSETSLEFVLKFVFGLNFEDTS